MRTVVLYHGNNGDHEFWEARKGGVCITKQQIVHDGILNPIFVRVHYSYSWINSSRGTIDLMLKQALSKRFNVEIHFLELTKRGYYDIRLTLNPRQGD